MISGTHFIYEDQPCRFEIFRGKWLPFETFAPEPFPFRLLLPRLHSTFYGSSVAHLWALLYQTILPLDRLVLRFQNDFCTVAALNVFSVQLSSIQSREPRRQPRFVGVAALRSFHPLTIPHDSPALQKHLATCDSICADFTRTRQPDSDISHSFHVRRPSSKQH